MSCSKGSSFSVCRSSVLERTESQLGNKQLVHESLRETLPGLGKILLFVSICFSFLFHEDVEMVCTEPHSWSPWNLLKLSLLSESLGVSGQFYLTTIRVYMLL